LIPAACFAALASVGLLTAALLPSHNENAEDDGRLCPHFDVDPNTGNLRNRGMIPCIRPAEQNSRLDPIRKSFSEH
jgi:hypothetical protein